MAINNLCFKQSISKFKGTLDKKFYSGEGSHLILVNYSHSFNILGQWVVIDFFTEFQIP